MSGAISPYDDIPTLINEIRQATYSIQTSLPAQMPTTVPIDSSVLNNLITSSKKLSSLIEKKEKQDIKYLVVGILSGLFFGIMGNIFASELIEIYAAVFPISQNLSWWLLELLVSGSIIAVASFWIWRFMQSRIKKVST